MPCSSASSPTRFTKASACRKVLELVVSVSAARRSASDHPGALAEATSSAPILETPPRMPRKRASSTLSVHVMLPPQERCPLLLPTSRARRHTLCGYYCATSPRSLCYCDVLFPVPGPRDVIPALQNQRVASGFPNMM